MLAADVSLLDRATMRLSDPPVAVRSGGDAQATARSTSDHGCHEPCWYRLRSRVARGAPQTAEHEVQCRLGAPLDRRRVQRSAASGAVAQMAARRSASHTSRCPPDAAAWTARWTRASASPRPWTTAGPASNSTDRSRSTSNSGEWSMDIGDGPSDQCRSSAPPEGVRRASSWTSAVSRNGQLASSRAKPAPSSAPSASRGLREQPRGQGRRTSEGSARHTTAPPPGP